MRWCSFSLDSVMALILCSCVTTTIGLPDAQHRQQVTFGKDRTVNLCVYLDDGVTEAQARYLLSSWDSEAPLYGLYLNPISFQEHPRLGFFHDQILADVSSIPLNGKCDRVMYFANRNAWDFAFANFPNPILWPVPEVLGEVDDATMSHGFVAAYPDSINGLIFNPYHVTRHELYHLLGSCPHALVMDQCYDRIAELKANSHPDFFASESEDGILFTRRDEVNDTLLAADHETDRATATYAAP